MSKLFSNRLDFALLLTGCWFLLTSCLSHSGEGKGAHFHRAVLVLAPRALGPFPGQQHRTVRSAASSHVSWQSLLISGSGLSAPWSCRPLLVLRALTAPLAVGRGRDAAPWAAKGRDSHSLGTPASPSLYLPRPCTPALPSLCLPGRAPQQGLWDGQGWQHPSCPADPRRGSAAAARLALRLMSAFLHTQALPNRANTLLQLSWKLESVSV